LSDGGFAVRTDAGKSRAEKDYFYPSAIFAGVEMERQATRKLAGYAEKLTAFALRLEHDLEFYNLAVFAADFPIKDQ